MPANDPQVGEMWATEHFVLTARIRRRTDHLVMYWDGRGTATEGLDSFLSRFGFVFSVQQVGAAEGPDNAA